MHLHLIGEGQLAHAIAKHFKYNNLDFDWFKSSEQKRYFNSSDIKDASGIYLAAIQDSNLNNFLDHFILYENSTIIIFSGNSDIKQFRLKYPNLNLIKLHPMMTFSNITDRKIFSNAPFYMDSKSVSKEQLESILRINNLHEFDVSNHSAYHMLGVFASNFQIALFKILEDIAIENNISSDQLREFIIPIMNQTLSNISQSSNLEDSLSGPVKRNDEETIQNHIEYLDSMNSNYSNIYELLTKELKKLI